MQADKGGKTVLMDKNDYIAKAKEKLNNPSVYEQVKKDPTKHIMEIKTEADKLFDLDKINVTQHYQLIGIEDLPTVRGQPKLHKPNNPMRIITCSRQTITSPVSKFVFNIIEDLRSTLSGIVMNASKFVQQINNLPIDNDENLTSLDI
ncbi:unnamed protein product [Didymodactylos carnosus]|uniref:Uncharacterized protein n=1 Tax=Didymodactylos carnosus TaxID=1234261 RepID=A0A8S2LXV7_9BILA|nr:unnamed protein product [Didymodactylos carnosus]